jgi:hypothetical protein
LVYFAIIARNEAIRGHREVAESKRGHEMLEDVKRSQKRQKRPFNIRGRMPESRRKYEEAVR